MGVEVNPTNLNIKERHKYVRSADFFLNNSYYTKKSENLNNAKELPEDVPGAPPIRRSKCYFCWYLSEITVTHGLLPL